ncbi:unnamed protein product [Cyprideis torosa]|uniref:Uncharacterized protein n=1 Tax=Cyprideis torosa TaxID=163714 RepID=A0A7R8W9C6_9CRUS|nr:unnamed protein product [Cyprideis torosa]CAG0884157.1 unnamed protein product [Cyprideis torosa]
MSYPFRNSPWWVRKTTSAPMKPKIEPQLETYGVVPTSLEGQTLIPIKPGQYNEVNPQKVVKKAASSHDLRREPMAAGMAAGNDLCGLLNFRSFNGGSLFVDDLPRSGDPETKPKPTEAQIYDAILAIEDANRNYFEHGGEWKPPLLAPTHPLRKLTGEEFYFDDWNGQPPLSPEYTEIAQDFPSVPLKKEISQSAWDAYYAKDSDKNPDLVKTGNEFHFQSGQSDQCDCQVRCRDPIRDVRAAPDTCAARTVKDKIFLGQCPLFRCPPYTPCIYQEEPPPKTSEKLQKVKPGLQGTELPDGSEPGSIYDPWTRLNPKLFSIPGYAMWPNEAYQCPFAAREALMGPIAGQEKCPPPMGVGQTTLPEELVAAKPFPGPSDCGTKPARPRNRVAEMGSQMAPVIMLDFFRDLQMMNMSTKFSLVLRASTEESSRFFLHCVAGNPSDKIIIDYDMLPHPENEEDFDRLNRLKLSCRIYKYDPTEQEYMSAPTRLTRPCYMDIPKYVPTGCADQIKKEYHFRMAELRCLCHCPKPCKKKCCPCKEGEGSEGGEGHEEGGKGKGGGGGGGKGKGKGKGKAAAKEESEGGESKSEKSGEGGKGGGGGEGGGGGG